MKVLVSSTSDSDYNLFKMFKEEFDSNRKINTPCILNINSLEELIKFQKKIAIPFILDKPKPWNESLCLDFEIEIYDDYRE